MFMFAAAVVVLLTAYALALPAVTMEGAGVDATGDASSEVVESSNAAAGVAASAGTGAKSVSAADEASAAGVGALSEADVSVPAATASGVSSGSNASAADAALTADSSDVSASAMVEGSKGNAAVGSGAEGSDAVGAQNAQGEKTDAQGSQDDEDESDLSSLSLDDEIVVQSSESTNDGDGSTTTSDPSILENLSLVKNGDDWMYIDDEANEDGSSFNKWQIVSGEYEGNEAANKTSSDDGNVRVQKNVIPTNVENEFLVYLSIDTKQLFSDFFASAEYQATTSNNYHDRQLGTIVDAMTGNEKVQVTGVNTSGYNHATFTFISSKGELLADNITLYWSQANNVTFYLKLNDNGTTKYVLTGLSVKSGKSETVMLSEEAERLIMSNVAQMANLNSVTDVMGDYIEYLGVVDDRYAKALSYDDKTQTLTWVPQVKTNPEIDKVKTNESKTVTWTDRDGKSHTETVYTYNSWALNVAELVYKVRLCTEQDDFQSAANNMSSVAGDAYSYPVNNSATLTYNDALTVDFPKPYVRGLLYNLPIKKVDEKGDSLVGATFELTGAMSGKRESTSETSDSNGLMKFTDLVGLDGKYSGTFQLSETSAPAGYTPLSGSITINLENYTSLGYACFVADTDGNMLRKATLADGSESASDLITSTGSWGKITIDNESASVSVPVVKIPNTKAGYRLPDTGGPGTTMLTVGGLLALATCLLYRCHVQTRRRREGN